MSSLQMNRGTFPTTKPILFDALHKFGLPGKAIFNWSRIFPPPVLKYKVRTSIEDGKFFYTSDYELNDTRTALSSEGHAEYMADKATCDRAREKYDADNANLLSFLLGFISDCTKTDLKTRVDPDSVFAASAGSGDTFRL